MEDVRASGISVRNDSRMTVIKKEDVEKEIDASGPESIADHPGHCGYEADKGDSESPDLVKETEDNQEVTKRK